MPLRGSKHKRTASALYPLPALLNAENNPQGKRQLVNCLLGRLLDLLVPDISGLLGLLHRNVWLPAWRRAWLAAQCHSCLRAQPVMAPDCSSRRGDRLGSIRKVSSLHGNWRGGPGFRPGAMGLLARISHRNGRDPVCPDFRKRTASRRPVIHEVSLPNEERK